MALQKIVYVSHALPDLSEAELQQILRSSVARNDAIGLTGFLLHGHGLFLQVLEGEADAVDATMHRIRCDPRHSHIQELQREPVQTREFARWTMGFKDLGRDDLAREPYLPYAGRALTLEQLHLRPRYALQLLRSVSA
jgi:Sensors of blue-light using FAD